MPVHQEDQICYLTSESLLEAKIPHAFIMRHGGVSPAPWESLNVGGGVGDTPEHVIENRYRSFRALGRDPDSLYDVWQVHGSDVVCTKSPRLKNQPYLQADCILTDATNVTLFMRFADCVPIMLYDPNRRIVGLVHAGWKGTLNQCVANAIHTMVAQYHSQPANILAVVGPSICAKHYEVGSEIVRTVERVFGDEAKAVLPNGEGGLTAGKAYFDLWQANRLIIERSGVRNIEITGQCTVCHNQDWFSHRAEEGKTGRFGVLIGQKA
jgi:hypothetical protein